MTVPTPRDLARLRSVRTWLLIVTAVLQGGQYVATPQRPLADPGPYVILEGIGEPGWRAIGVVLVAIGVSLAFTATRTVGYFGVALLETFLGLAQIVHGYVPSTLILPIGLALLEVSLSGSLRQRSRRKG